MNHAIVLDPFSSLIAGLSGPTELRDQSGSVLGIFTPAIQRAPGEPEDTLEELEAAFNEPGGVTLNEIWKSLGVK